jgi:hypothetical protein
MLSLKFKNFQQNQSRENTRQKDKYPLKYAVFKGAWIRSPSAQPLEAGVSGI